jgi:hypothetical protein
VSLYFISECVMCVCVGYVVFSRLVCCVGYVVFSRLVCCVGNVVFVG